MSVNFVPVTSSNVSAVGYEDDSRTLWVQFHKKVRSQIVGTRTYYYMNVPRHIFDDFLSAPSKGKYFNRHVEGWFFYKEV